eukprot:CAMPEP_0172162840 /NCGR_PEP_ID=MMETSP1050-20130122/6921_1 /TAXON_ID=233186 /ORGANISM="Cryptomonas curvata, Strain CCAP979/52" /LENGTH=187 /DNA_ID=CAMNT_0012832927 /DNA_START=221 /DNA_END=784 /DNA_ORIENTATION=-
MEIYQYYLGGTTQGSVYKAIFFSRLNTSGLSLLCHNLSIVALDGGHVQEYDCESATIVPVLRKAWMKPLSQTDIGFDAVFVNQDAKLAFFVQLSQGDEDSFRMEGAKSFLDKLSCPIEIVEFGFVAREDVLFKFKISQGFDKRSGKDMVTGRGGLSGYKVAGKECHWPSGLEQEYVTFFGMDDRIYL